MNYRQSQFGQGWEAGWITWDYPYAYAEQVDGLGGERWEIVTVAPYTLEGIKSLVTLWEDNGRKGAVIYDGHMRGFPVGWVENALRGKGDPRHQSDPDVHGGATYGLERLAFDHSAENPVFGFDHFGNREGVQL